MKRFIALFVAVLMTLSLVTGCSKETAVDTQDTSKETAKDTLNLSLRSDIASFDPREGVSESDNAVRQAMFMNLFYMTIDSKEIRSEACEKWEVSENAMEYTFTLKPDIKFHNGEELTASDVVFSVNEAMKSPAQMSWSMLIDRAEVVSDYIVKIIMKEPYASFLQVADLVLLDEKTTIEEGEAFRENPVGSGPYKFVSYQPGYQLVLEAYDGYTGTKPEFKNVVYRINTDASAAIIAAETGEVDFLMSTAFSQYESLKDNEDLKVTTFDYGVDYLIMNNTVAPFDNKDVRLAINYAIDKQSCSDVYTEGLAQLPLSYISTIKSEELTGYPYDVELAKEYLTKAGYPDGQGFPSIKIETLDTYRTYAQIIQRNLKDIGINAEIVIGEPTTFISELMKGNIPFSIVGMGLGVDPSSYSGLLISNGPFNFVKYSNQEVDDLFAKAKTEVDDALRNDIYVEILKKAQADAPYGLVGNQLLMYVYSDRDVDFSFALENRAKPYIRPQDVTRK